LDGVLVGREHSDAEDLKNAVVVSDKGNPALPTTGKPELFPVSKEKLELVTVSLGKSKRL